jgi:hypothetical protein
MNRWWALLLLCGSGLANGYGMSVQECTSAGRLQASMHGVIQRVPPGGLSDLAAQDDMARLDEEWKRAFGATAAIARYQEAIEDYVLQAKAVIVSARRSKDDPDVIFSHRLQMAREQEALGFARVVEESQHACKPAP